MAIRRFTQHAAATLGRRPIGGIAMQFSVALPFVSTEGNVLITAQGSVITSRGVRAQLASAPRRLPISAEGSLLQTSDGSLIYL